MNLLNSNSLASLCTEARWPHGWCLDGPGSSPCVVLERESASLHSPTNVFKWVPANLIPVGKPVID